MVVAFYSPMHGQAGTSCNLVSIALLLAMKYHKKLFLMESHFEKNALESMFIKPPKHVESPYFEDFGIDLLVRSKALGQLKEEQLINASFSFLKNQIHLLPGTRQVNREIFEQSVQQTIIEIIEVANRNHDMVFIDVNASQDELTKQILKRADLVVFNLSQNPWLIRQLKESEVYRNQIYLIGNYDKDSCFSQKNLSYLFPFLSKKNTVSIPYDVSFKDAVYNAAVIPYMRKQSLKEVKKKKKPYIKGVLKACDLILKKEGEKSG